ncbi:MAG: hypothetical protein HQL19_01105 [Candidatus Omnitrophica bacterium]|nr:hypothetical protein [Candidatus Omnitrophota bacterium]
MKLKFGALVLFMVMAVCFSDLSLAREDMPMMMQDQPVFSLPSVNPPMRVISSNVTQRLFQIPGQIPTVNNDMGLVNWIRSNVSSKTGMFLSFQVLPDEKHAIYSSMGSADSVPGVIERVIVENGVVIYDGAVGQIALTLSGSADDMAIAQKPLDIYWKGGFGDLQSVRAGYPNNNFVYDPKAPEAVTSNVEDKGRRGFIYRIINANGDYLSADPLDGKKRLEGFPTWPDIHWEDWKPVAGENAWVVIAAMQVYHKKYFDPLAKTYVQHPEAVELRLAEELARVALMLQAENGGIRMAPIGTFRENEPAQASGQGSWWYNQISTENNLSWYSALRMLYRVTGKEEYLIAMAKMEGYFKQVFNKDDRFFYQGMSYVNGAWQVNASDFAVDVQTWGILALGADTIDGWFGEGAAYNAWQRAKAASATRNSDGRLLGVGYTTESGRVSVEWTAGAIMATRQLAAFYDYKHPDWSTGLKSDVSDMRAGMELLRRDLPGGKSAYAYSSKRGWIPFGWNSHDPRVMSLASTGWMLFVDRDYNPFVINGSREDGVFTTAKLNER